MSERVENVVVVGRDAPLWVTAAAVQRSFARTGVHVRVIDLPTVLQPADVYAAVPPLIGLHEQLGLDEALVMRACNAAPMVAQRFSNWSGAGPAFLHGYDDKSPDGDLEFVHYWIKGRQEGLRSEFENFSIGAMAAKTGRVPIGLAGGDQELTAGYGYHLDAGRYSALVRQLALRLGVEAKTGSVSEIDVEGERIRAVTLADGERVEADLFIDASGGEAVLVGKMPGTQFQSWRRWFPCNRMIAASGKRLTPTPAFSQISAFGGGWVGLYPLQDRTAVVAVYDSGQTSDRQMVDDLPLLARLPIAGAAVVSALQQGIRARTWIGNCVAIGEAAFALEPLDALQLHIAHSCISHLIAFFPVERDEFPEAVAYDRAIQSLAGNMRDFQLGHYKLNRRFDEPLWDRCRDAAVADSLQGKIDLFAARGDVALYDNEPFAEQNWTSLFLGHGLVPESYDPRIDRVPEQELVAKVHGRLQTIAAQVGAMPAVDEFLSDAARQDQLEGVEGA